MNTKRKKILVLAGMAVVVIMLVMTIQLVLSISRSGDGDHVFWIYFFNHDGDFNLWIQSLGSPRLYPLLTGLLAIGAGVFGFVRYKKRFYESVKLGILFLFTIGIAHIMFSFLINRETFPRSESPGILALLVIPTMAAVIPAAFGIMLKLKWAWGLAVSWFVYNFCGYVVFIVLKNIFIITSRYQWGQNKISYELAWYVSDILTIWPAIIGFVVLLLIRKYIFDWSAHFEVSEEKKEISLFVN